MSRWKAAAIHLILSAIIGAAVGVLLFGVWYPPPYFHAAGADELIILLVGVDLVLGPLLTLIVFRSGKWGMKFDLCVIALAQSIALVYGLGVVLQSPRIFLVGAVDRFVVVSANEITDNDLAKGSEPRFRTRSWTGPRLTIGAVPTDSKEQEALAFDGMAGRDLQNQPRYFRDYAALAPELAKRAKPLDVLRKIHPNDIGSIDRWLSEHQRRDEDTRWLPLQARKSDMIMLMDEKSGEPLGALAIEPIW